MYFLIVGSVHGEREGRGREVRGRRGEGKERGGEGK